MHTRKIRTSLLVSLVALGLASCSESPTTPGTGTVRVQMTDAPGDVQAVNLVITQVSVHLAGSAADSVSGWQVLNSSTQTVDLMTLQNGTFTTIAQARVPVGNFTQLRLLLGAGSTVVVNGVTYPLTIPSGFQTGLKI